MSIRNLVDCPAAGYSYTVSPRSTVLGGGWLLKFFIDGEEVGGGVFSSVDSSSGSGDFADSSYFDAIEEGENFIALT